MSSIFHPKLFVAVFFAASLALARAETPSVDQLIKKLPPPEKVTETDPASRDPMVKQIIDATKSMNFGSAYSLSRKLASRYPKSAGAQLIHGQLSLLVRRYPEASDAFHKAISIQPNFAFAYVGLALSESAQNHISGAMSNFRQVTRLNPNAEIGWIGLSACSEKLGRKGDSLDYARRATSVAPKSFAAWLQLSRAEGISGNQQAAEKALARAKQLQQNARRR
jgi:tetratricopeptide (TPR) repeat protein